MIYLLTSLDFLSVGQQWPPPGEAERLQLYTDNKNLFEGRHELVFDDWVRILREDQQAALKLVLNWHERLSTLWADLLLGEPPTITAGEAGTKEQEAVDRIIKDNDLANVNYEVVIDNSRYGTGIYKLRVTDRVIIEAQPPDCWFPVVDPTNVKNIIAHVLAWTWTESKSNMFGQTQETKYLQAEVHEKGRITTKKFIIDGSTINKQLPLEGIPDMVATGVDAFLVRPFHNLLTSDRVYGIDDYSKIDGIIQEMEIRLSQISRILDKHSDPNLYGPETALEYDPETHQYSFKAGGKYFPVDSKDDVVPGYLVWDGQLTAAFNEFDKLMEQLYFLTETSPAAFGQLKSGLAESGSALKRLMMATLAKVNRVRMRIDPALKEVLKTAAALEVSRGIKGAVKLENISIAWRDGIPDDPRETHAIENEDFTMGTVSLETVLKGRGFTGQALEDEIEAIKGAQAVVVPPNITLES